MAGALVSGDAIDLSFSSILGSFAEVQAAVSQSGVDPLIDVGGSATLILESCTVDSLASDNLLF